MSNCVAFWIPLEYWIVLFGVLTLVFMMTTIKLLDALHAVSEQGLENK